MRDVVDVRMVFFVIHVMGMVMMVAYMVVMTISVFVAIDCPSSAGRFVCGRDSVQGDMQTSVFANVVFVGMVARTMLDRQSIFFPAEIVVRVRASNPGRDAPGSVYVTRFAVDW